jgi:hypothetical protein
MRRRSIGEILGDAGRRVAESRLVNLGRLRTQVISSALSPAHLDKRRDGSAAEQDVSDNQRRSNHEPCRGIASRLRCSVARIGEAARWASLSITVDKSRPTMTARNYPFAAHRSSKRPREPVRLATDVYRMADAHLASDRAVSHFAFLGESRSTIWQRSQGPWYDCNSRPDVKRIEASEFGEAPSSVTSRRFQAQYRDAYWNFRSRTWKIILPLRQGLPWIL